MRSQFRVTAVLAAAEPGKPGRHCRMGGGQSHQAVLEPLRGGFRRNGHRLRPGRMGFGLFVPEFRSVFSMSTSTVGFVSSLGFLGFFIGLLIAQALLDRRGPGAPVLSGLAAATIGMGIIALAPGVPVLAIGVFLAVPAPASHGRRSTTPFTGR
ncbi:hypothetical protein SAMN05444340_13013 [Citreimonas salinaria]|uniref:Major facilitator superfamily (MFS) profile domain-containing protein n=2 Tax=Citreimonas salinaria TaxID=321339 RepID=A0A1H3NSX6_9RHOB|nr:hypothetical protein SAMN05444340_13013 [Citreimonas salinaria]